MDGSLSGGSQPSFVVLEGNLETDWVSLSGFMRIDGGSSVVTRSGFIGPDGIAIVTGSGSTWHLTGPWDFISGALAIYSSTGTTAALEILDGGTVVVSGGPAQLTGDTELVLKGSGSFFDAPRLVLAPYDFSSETRELVKVHVGAGSELRLTEGVVVTTSDAPDNLASIEMRGGLLSVTNPVSPGDAFSVSNVLDLNG